MNDKEFRKLRREDLIEIIYQYQRREQRLTQENEMLRRELEDRRLKIQNCGSVAEAALALSGVFEAAQKAADQYLQEIRSRNDAPHPASAEAAVQKPTVTEKPEDPLPAAKPRNPQPAEKPAEQKMRLSSQNKPAGTEIPQKPAESAAKMKESAAARVPEKSAEVKAEKTENSQVAAKPKKTAPAAETSGREVPRKSQQPRPQAKPESNPGKNVDTDAFIASLKDYLGM